MSKIHSPHGSRSSSCAQPFFNGDNHDGSSGVDFNHCDRHIEHHTRLCRLFTQPKNSSRSTFDAGVAQTKQDLRRSPNLLLQFQNEPIWHSNLSPELLDFAIKRVNNHSLNLTKPTNQDETFVHIENTLKKLVISKRLVDYLLSHLNQGALLAVNAFYKYYRAEYLLQHPDNTDAGVTAKLDSVRCIKILNEDTFRYSTSLYQSTACCHNDASMKRELIASTELMIQVDNHLSAKILHVNTERAETMPDFYKDEDVSINTVYRYIENKRSQYDPEIECLLSCVEHSQLAIRNMESDLRSNQDEAYTLNRRKKIKALSEIVERTKCYVVHKAYRSPSATLAKVRDGVKNAITKNARILSTHVNILKRIWNALVGYKTIRLDGSRPVKHYGFFHPAGTRSTRLVQEIANASICQPSRQSLP